MKCRSPFLFVGAAGNGRFVAYRRSRIFQIVQSVGSAFQIRLDMEVGNMAT